MGDECNVFCYVFTDTTCDVLRKANLKLQNEKLFRFESAKVILDRN